MKPWESAVIDLLINGYLSSKGVPNAVIGAVALAVHGAPRYSADIDLLVMNRAVLHRSFWADCPVQPLELRQGDDDDPLAGLVRFDAPNAVRVDLVVGKGYAAQFSISTAALDATLGSRVATPLGLSLLKLEAGGYSDMQDLVALFEVQRALTGWNLLDAVAPEVQNLTAHGQQSWEKLQRVLGRDTAIVTAR